MVKRLAILLLLGLSSLTVFSQKLISYISLNTNSAYVGQPVELTVSVYTSTWFTSGVDLGNLQIDGALTVYFRSVSSTKIFDGKNHAGVEFIYNVFPVAEGELTIPPLTIRVESPKEDDYKGVKQTLKTRAGNITVMPVPPGYNPNNWLVATSLNIRESWSAPLSTIRVGDVVQRTITRSAGGTLAEFIPATRWDSIDGIGIYPRRAQVNTDKSKIGVSSRRSETVNYLFEKEGEVTIPAIEYVYWNSATKRFYKKRIDSVTLRVKANPDLAMLESIRRSLQAEEAEELEDEEKEFLILGMPVAEFAKYLAASLFLIFALYKIGGGLTTLYRKKQAAYLKTEIYAFKRLKKAIEKKDFHAVISSSKSWLAKLSGNSGSLQELAKESDSKKLADVLNQINESWFKYNRPGDEDVYSVLLEELKLVRKTQLRKQQEGGKFPSQNEAWLNPGKIN